VISEYICSDRAPAYEGRERWAQALGVEEGKDMCKR
jgi:hypothetical protein